MACSSGTCGKKTKVDVQVTQGIKNLDWILPAASIKDSIQITTLTSDKKYKIDAKTSQIYPGPVLVEGTLATMSMQKTTGKVWKSTELVYTFNAFNGVPNLGLIHFDFENEAIQQGNNAVKCEDMVASKNLVCTVEKYSSSLYIKRIKVSDLPAIGVGS